MKVFTGASLVDVYTGDVLKDAALVIEGDLVAFAGPSSDVPADQLNSAEDLGGGYVIPGMISCHTHFDLGFDGTHGENIPARMLRAASNARKTLASGVTTVRMVGTSDGLDFALRNSISRGETVGPRIYTAGNGMCSTGGHGAKQFIEADSPEGFRRAARTQVSLGADLIKIVPSGGVAAPYERAGDSHLTFAEIEAAADAAHAWGKHITAHLGGADTIRMAIDAGIDCVEHGYELDAETAQYMADRGIYLSPTIGVTRAEEFYRRVGQKEELMNKALTGGVKHWAGLIEAIKCGVKILAGTDMYPHEPLGGTSAHIREMEFYQEAGLSPLAVLQTATVNPAEILGETDRIGSLVKGALGDFLVMDENPIDDVSALRTIRQVVRGGTTIE